MILFVFPFRSLDHLILTKSLKMVTYHVNGTMNGRHAHSSSFPNVRDCHLYYDLADSD